jgi:hypothetical protein
MAVAADMGATLLVTFNGLRLLRMVPRLSSAASSSAALTDHRP